MTVNLSELLDAFELARSGAMYDCTVYVCSETGAVYVTSSEDPLEEDEQEIPEDLETSDRYLIVPSQADLDLGRSLALRFTERELPEACDDVAGMFNRQGAYGRFKALLEHRGKLERWYRFEEEKTVAALRSWCEENGLQVG